MLILLLSCSKATFPAEKDGVLQPNFWMHFDNSLGCWPDHLYAWNKEGTVGIDVFIANAFARPDDPSSIKIDLSKPGNIVMVETGKQIPDNFCVEQISIIPVARVYESTSGILDVSIDHKGNRLGVTLQDVTIKHKETNHVVNIPSVTFPLQDLYPKR